MNCGTVLYDPNFQFTNGKTIDKLLIVLCEAGTDHYVLTTTSQPHSKRKQPGCLSDDHPPSFYISKGTCWFNLDTWVELQEVNEIQAEILEQKRKDRGFQEHKDVLPAHLIRDILDCALNSDYIDEYYKEFLRRERSQL